MKDIEKRIYEMAKDIHEELETENIPYHECNFMAQRLIKKGWIKSNENSVVLSKEELKELVQKIYDDIFAILKIKLWLYGDDAMTKNLNGLTKQKILDFTKKWGIEDNHLNEKDYSHIDYLQAHDKQIKEQASNEMAEKFIKECKKYKVKKFSPIGIDQRDIGVSWIEMPEWKLDEFAKQFNVEIKE